MNITKVQIDDPRRRGEYRDPVIILDVDEEVFENSIRRVEGLTIGNCGPFYSVEIVHPDLHTHQDADMGEFNKMGLVRDQLIRIDAVRTPTETFDDLTMPVARLRRLLRKHGLLRGVSGWKVIVDEEAALEGKLSWRVERIEPICFYAPCGVDTRGIVRYRGAHIPVCFKHRPVLEGTMSDEVKSTRAKTTR